MDGANFLELRKKAVPDADKVCWVCAGSGGKYKNCPECEGRGFNPKRPGPPPRAPETQRLLTGDQDG